MKKTLFLLTCAVMCGTASAASVAWTGAGGSNDWTEGSNWDSGSAPSSGDTIVIDEATVVWAKAPGAWGSSSTVYRLTNGATLTLGNTTASSSAPVSNPRFDGQFHVGAGCVLNVNAMFGYGLSQIDGTVNIYNVFDPGENNALSFGVNGVMNYMSGSMNGVEGNGRTTTISAVLNTGIVTLSSEYGIEKRYLIAGAEGGSFNVNIYQSWTLAAGVMTGSDGSALMASVGDLIASADTFGQYKLGNDAGGVYVEYVTATPEPATASLSLLGLAALMMRRRRS